MALNNQKLTAILSKYIVTNKPMLIELFSEDFANMLVQSSGIPGNWTCVDSEGVSGTRPPECYPKGAKAYKLFILAFSAKGWRPELKFNRHLFRCHIWYNQQEVIKMDYEKFLELESSRKVE